jgi:hypothetical protein
MDNVNIESTLNYIEKIDKKLIDEIDNITFELNGLSTEGQKLLQILNYSPKVIKANREKIKNLKNIEMPQLSELVKLDYSKLDIDNTEIKNKKEIKNAIINLAKNIINDIIKNIDFNNSNHKKDYKEEKKIEISDNNLNIKNENENKISNTSSSSEIKLEDNFSYELKVFLFNKDDFIIINITPNETIKMVKEKIINKILAEKDYEITNEKDYELRIVEKIGDKFIYKFFHFQDIKPIIDNNIKIIAFVENKLYKVKSSKI